MILRKVIALKALNADNRMMEEDMNLTNDQVKAIENGEPVPVVVGKTEIVLIRKDVYEKLLTLYDDSEFSPIERYAAMEEVLSQEDDPGLDSYQVYK